MFVRRIAASMSPSRTAARISTLAFSVMINLEGRG